MVSPHSKMKGNDMTRGGKREGAGRPEGTGKYNCKTGAIRVPETQKESILRMIESPVDFEKTCESRAKYINTLRQQLALAKEALDMAATNLIIPDEQSSEHLKAQVSVTYNIINTALKKLDNIPKKS